jgi:hypothetical protein
MSDADLPASTRAPGAAGDAAAEPSPVGSQSGDAHGAVPHAGAQYAVLRLALAVTTGGILYLFGLRGWALLFLAVLISGGLSFFVFMRQREAAARNLEAMVQARKGRHEPAAAGTEPSEVPEGSDS